MPPLLVLFSIFSVLLKSLAMFISNVTLIHFEKLQMQISQSYQRFSSCEMINGEAHSTCHPKGYYRSFGVI